MNVPKFITMWNRGVRGRENEHDIRYTRLEHDIFLRLPLSCWIGRSCVLADGQIRMAVTNNCKTRILINCRRLQIHRVHNLKRTEMKAQMLNCINTSKGLMHDTCLTPLREPCATRWSRYACINKINKNTDTLILRNWDILINHGVEAVVLLTFTDHH